MVRSLVVSSLPGKRRKHDRVIDIDKVFFKKGDVVEGSDGSTMTMDYRAIDVPPIHTDCRCFVWPFDVTL